jgi:hypothetical protein
VEFFGTNLGPEGNSYSLLFLFILLFCLIGVYTIGNNIFGIYLSFLIVTIFLMAFLLRFIEPHPWRSVLSWTLIGSFGSYLIFEIWMKLRLPRGFWGV